MQALWLWVWQMIFKWPLNDYDACKLLEVQANQFNYPNNPDKLKKRSLNFFKKVWWGDWEGGVDRVLITVVTTVTRKKCEITFFTYLFCELVNQEHNTNLKRPSPSLYNVYYIICIYVCFENFHWEEWIELHSTLIIRNKSSSNLWYSIYRWSGYWSPTVNVTLKYQGLHCQHITDNRFLNSGIL